MVKKCSKCKKVLPVENFTFRVRGGKLRSYCRSCTKEYNKSYRLKNLVRLKTQKAKYYQENKDKILKQHKEYYIENKDRMNECNRIWKKNNFKRKKYLDKRWAENNQERANRIKYKFKKNNPEKVKKANRDWGQKNSEIKENISRRYRANKMGLNGSHTVEDIRKIFTDQQGQCRYCNTDIRGKYTVDHIIPVSRKGSTNYPDNLQLLCGQCNSSKGNKTHDEYSEYLNKKRLMAEDKSKSNAPSANR